MRSVLTPKRPAWLVGSLVAMVLAVAVYWLWGSWTPWRAGRAGGLTFGTIAAIVFLFDGLYPLRRRLLAWPLRTAQRWLQLHIYGGVFALVCVFIHVGFTLPRGTMGWGLLGLSLWTVATGVVGVGLQKWIPSVIAQTMHVEVLAARVPELVARLRAEADDVMRGASDRLLIAYQTEIRPALERPEPAWSYVANVQTGRTRYEQSLERLDRTVVDRNRVEGLRTIMTEKAEVDVHLSLQRALRAWVALHAIPAIALLGLLAVHIFAVLFF